MLSLHKHIKHHIFKFFAPAHQLQFSPVSADNDELTQAIEADYKSTDRNWHLEPHPDVRQLDEFWTQVQQDLHADPTWHRFSD